MICTSRSHSCSVLVLNAPVYCEGPWESLVQKPDLQDLYALFTPSQDLTCFDAAAGTASTAVFSRQVPTHECGSKLPPCRGNSVIVVSCGLLSSLRPLVLDYLFAPVPTRKPLIFSWHLVPHLPVRRHPPRKCRARCNHQAHHRRVCPPVVRLAVPPSCRRPDVFRVGDFAAAAHRCAFVWTIKEASEVRVVLESQGKSR